MVLCSSLQFFTFSLGIFAKARVQGLLLHEYTFCITGMEMENKSLMLESVWFAWVFGGYMPGSARPTLVACFMDC